jgi:hypothetical protein
VASRQNAGEPHTDGTSSIALVWRVRGKNQILNISKGNIVYSRVALSFLRGEIRILAYIKEDLRSGATGGDGVSGTA